MKWGVDKYLFMVGAGLALVAGLADSMSWMMEGGVVAIAVSTVLAVLGLAIGLMNIKDNESVAFAVFALGLSVGLLALGLLGIVGAYISPIMVRFGTMVAGTALVVCTTGLFKTMKAK